MRRSWLASGLKTVRRIGMVALAAVAVLALATPRQAQARWGKEFFGDLKVVDQNGRTLRFYDDLVKDRIVLVSFFYTSCRELCPLTVSRLSELQDLLGDDLGRKFFIYSLSVNPEVDTPERLKEYADTFGAKPGWLFLTGEPEENRALRYKLGDRGRWLEDHRHRILLGNGTTNEWAKNSVSGDLKVLEYAFRGMDPDWRIHGLSRRAPKTVYADLDARAGEALFTRLCKGCHTVGKGDKVGPDLAGVTQRRERDWLLKFISAPERMRQQKDPIAMQLVAQFPTVRMPPMGIPENNAEDLLEYITNAEVREARRQPLQSLSGLTTHTGELFTPESVKGKPAAVFFGFTHCPDVCPTTLMDWSNVLANLGEDGDRLQVVFVTIDSQRDTRKALASYMTSFDPRIVALTGDGATITHATRVFGAFHERIEGKDGGYTFDHTTNVYLIGRDGRLADKVDLRTPPQERDEKLAKLLAGSSATVAGAQ